MRLLKYRRNTLLTSPEGTSQLTQGSSEIANSLAGRQTALTVLSSTSSTTAMEAPTNRKLFHKRGSLTINSHPQQFNYNEQMPPIERQTISHQPKTQDNNDEQRLHRSSSPSRLSNNDAMSQLLRDGDESDGEILDETGEQQGYNRQSSSSSKSQPVPSWRPWINTTCCCGYFHIRCTWIIHPQGPLSYIWLLIVSAAALHNIINIPLRFAFCGWNMNYGIAVTTEQLINGSTNYTSALTAIPAAFSGKDLAFWMVPDYFCDLIYAIDILKSMRTGYFEEGFMNSHPQSIFNHYVGSASFYADVVSLLPLDLLYLSFGLNSLLRTPRLIKTYRCFQFVGWCERHTRWPNVVRSTKMFVYVLVICHWNAALCKAALQGYEKIWFDKETLKKNETETPRSNSSGDFLASAVDLPFYWAWLYVSVSTLCTLGLSGTSGLSYYEPPYIFAFLTLQMMLGLVLFAVTIGEILLIVDNLGAGRREFQMHLDAVKNYIGKREIPKSVSIKIIRWFEYIWESKRGFDEERRHLMVLPDCLQAEISLHAYLHTLKSVEFFRNTEAGFLKELVLKLKPVLFGPGEIVCRKGEIGRQMFLIEVGLLQVFNGKHINTKPVAHLKKGQYFGELSILNMGKAGNRRTATIRSLGYSHLLSLCKEDLFAVLQDFPKERARLEFFAAKRLEKYQHEKMQEKLKRHQNHEVLLEHEVEHDSSRTSTRCLLESECQTETVMNGVVATVIADHQPMNPPSQTTISISSDSNPEDDGVVWLPAKPHNFAPADFISECDLSPLTPISHVATSEKRRLSLTTSTMPLQNSYHRSNLMARFRGAPHSSSPLLHRAARSMDIITGRESVL